jgi:hypothetical protein
MDRKKWMFIFAALGGIGGLACILQWAEIKPKDLWGWHVSLAVPHWLWLIIGLGLLGLSLLVSVSGLCSAVRGDRASNILRTENERLRTDYEILNEQFVKMAADFNRAVSTIGQLTAPKSSKLIIHSAIYAAWSGRGRRYDVTRFLRSIVTGDSLVFGPIESRRSRRSLAFRRRLRRLHRRKPFRKYCQRHRRRALPVDELHLRHQ